MLCEAMKKLKKKYRRSLKGEIHGASKMAQLEKMHLPYKTENKRVLFLYAIAEGSNTYQGQ